MSLPKIRPKSEWVLTQAAFDGFLASLDRDQGRDFFRTATSTAAIVLVGLLVWQINYRWSTTSEIRQLRAGVADPGKPTETLVRSPDTEQSQTLERPTPLDRRRAQPESPAHRERTTPIPQHESQLSEITTERESAPIRLT